VFLLHGIRSHKESLVEVAEHLARGGYRAVLVDSRGQGRSTGEWLTYGVQESRDLSQLLDALHVPGSMPVGVMGASYGAATAIEWAGREPRIGAAVALAPFASLRDVAPGYVRRALPGIGRVLPMALVQATVNAAGRMARFDPDEASPVRVIAARDVPVLIFHGTADDHIPAMQSRFLATTAPEHTSLVLLEGQGHNGIAGDSRLWPAVLDFLDRSLKRAK
jgi:pimeloyl-ACP methyl ester carboxylesterase